MDGAGQAGRGRREMIDVRAYVALAVRGRRVRGGGVAGHAELGAR